MQESGFQRICPEPIRQKLSTARHKRKSGALAWICGKTGSVVPIDFEPGTLDVKQDHSLTPENPDVHWNGEWRGMVPVPPNIPVALLLKRQLMEL